MEMLEVDAAVDDVQLFRRDAKAALDLVAHHLRVADHGAQPRVLEHAPLGAADVAVVGIEGHAEPLERSRRRAPELEPAPVHPVSRAVQVASRNALVRLHHLEPLAAPGAARRPTFHGPHTSSLLGPNRATVGVPIAAARCIGIESTPMKRRARAVSAPSSLIESLPARLTGVLWHLPRISFTSEISSSSAAD